MINGCSSDGYLFYVIQKEIRGKEDASANSKNQLPKLRNLVLLDRIHQCSPHIQTHAHI